MYTLYEQCKMQSNLIDILSIQTKLLKNKHKCIPKFRDHISEFNLFGF